MKVFCFLGNPGRQYKLTRHNLPWILAESWSRVYGAQWNNKFKAEFAWLPSDSVYILKPLTYMNLSGDSVNRFLQFFKVDAKSLFVVHDDIELDFGVVQVRQGGGLAGHNGLRSIKKILGTDQFFRVRLGIGRPQREPVESYVLSRFSKHEEALLPDFTSQACIILDQVLDRSFDRFQQKIQCFS